MSFRFPCLALVALASACQTAETDDVVAPVPTGPDPLLVEYQAGFPAPTGPLTLPTPEDSAGHLGVLVERLVSVTGLNLSIGDESRAKLSEEPLGFEASVEIPPEEVYPFVEGLLVDHGFLLRNLHIGSTSLFALTHLDEVGDNVAQSIPILRSDTALTLARQHPALLITAAVQTGRSNARQLAASYRTAINQPPTERLLAPDVGTILVTGNGRFVDGMVRVLQARVVAERFEKKELREEEARDPDF